VVWIGYLWSLFCWLKDQNIFMAHNRMHTIKIWTNCSVHRIMVSTVLVSILQSSWKWRRVHW
jgi:hypothetical protein